MVKKVSGILLMLFLVSLAAFLLLELSSGSRELYLLGDYATSESVAELSRALGSSGTFISRYLLFLYSFFTLQWGEDIKGNSILSLVSSRLSMTLELSLLSIFLSVALSLVVAIFSKRRRQSFFDKITDALSILIFSLPSFVLSLVLVLLLPMFPTGGFVPISRGLGRNLLHMVLPVLSSTLMHYAILVRVLKRSLARELEKPYARSALARGGREEDQVLVVLRSASIPYLALISESFCSMLAGSCIIESIFSLPGLGSLFVSAALSRDSWLATILVLLFFILVSVSSIISEAVMRTLDPRIRRSIDE